LVPTQGNSLRRYEQRLERSEKNNKFISPEDDLDVLAEKLARDRGASGDSRTYLEAVRNRSAAAGGMGTASAGKTGQDGPPQPQLIGLKCHDLAFDSIVIEERYCRGDWSEPKSSASNATIGVGGLVIERIHRLKLVTVEVKAGLRRISEIKIPAKSTIHAVLDRHGLVERRDRVRHQLRELLYP
jgi:hypothetical protein